MIYDMIPNVRPTVAALLTLALLTLTACGGQASQDTNGGDPAETTASGQASGQKYPDVQEAELERSGDTWSLSVTISSPYDSPERYADGWRVLAPNGDVLGKHELMHDHANEQPFTRSQSGLEIPQDVQEITVEGRDLENGYGGETVTIPVPRG